MAVRTLLVANRGEIALRVMRTCRRLGIRTVALATDADRSAPHVRAADDSVHVPSYLDIEAVVDAALRSGADAVHPGYGFLSERAAFARALEAAGVTLVGPTADVMDLMGRKDRARDVALAAGVPVVPSYGIDDDPAGFAWPVLVKAAAGGGGKGMRVVRDRSDYDAGVAAARREAGSAFGDDTLLVEKYVESGRHVEVQVMADAHGDVVHLFERDCSTQRRHQKVLEEAPAPTITADQRAEITSSAVALARQVGYRGAGTVEFLLDDATGEFYFLEMNTRLQVEHPVTEAVVSTGSSTGGWGPGSIDLVEHQIRVAAGEPLALRQEDLHLAGHAIEARVYAEDSFGGFLPQAGTATLVRWPEGPGVRVDHALESGQVVSTSYDPMLGKVVVHGPDRESARLGLVAALDRTAILGLTTNTGFLRALVASDSFRDTGIDTAWLDRATVDRPGAEVPLVIAAWTEAALLDARVTGGPAGDPFATDGWRVAGRPAPVLVELESDGELRVLAVDRLRGEVHEGGEEGRRSGVEELEVADHVVVLRVDGRRHRATVHVQPHAVEVVHLGHRHVFARPDVFGDQAAVVGDGTITAPMPGTVLEVTVAPGDEVAEGQVLGMMEAMKMELSLKAPFAGVVTDVTAAAGAQVAMGAPLFVVEEVAP